MKALTLAPPLVLCLTLPLLAQKSTTVSDGGVTFKPEITLPLDQCSDPENLPNVAMGMSNIVHYVNWTDQENFTERWLVKGQNVSTPDSKRIFGSSKVRVVVVHYNIAASTEVKYKVDVKKKSPSWLENLNTLLGLAPAAGRICRAGYLELLNVPVPSDIVVSGQLTPKNGGGPPAPAVGGVAPAPAAGGAGAGAGVAGGAAPGGVGLLNSPPIAGEQDGMAFTETFDNEGKYWADFSFGLPALNNKLTDFQVVDGVLQRKEGSRAAAYGFLNIFPGPRDTKSQAMALPHLMIGLPLTGQALRSPVVATGYNINRFGIKFGIYAGVSFNRTTTLVEGTEERDIRWVRKLTVGLNIPVAQFVSAYLKKK